MTMNITAVDTCSFGLGISWNRLFMQASTAFLAAGLALEGSQEFLRVLMSPYCRFVP